MLLALMLVVFVSLFFGFRFFARAYVQSSAETQLHQLAKGAPLHAGQGTASEEGLDVGRKHRSEIGVIGQTIRLDASYRLTDHQPMQAAYEYEEHCDLAEALKEAGIPLDGAKAVAVQTDHGEYMVSSLAVAGEEAEYWVFFVDISGARHLIAAVNIGLGVLMAIAMGIALGVAGVIARSVSRPIEELAQFAGEMGQGRFERREFRFRDLEFFQLGEAMNLSAEKLGRYDKEQRTFFQNASHELRTPLQAIRCYAEGIEVGVMEPAAAGRVILSETDRLAELVEDILYISRVDNLTGAVELSLGDVRELLSRCAEALSPVAGQRGLCFELQFDENPVWMDYNEKHLYRAFSNLISNALRYAEKTITLYCRSERDRIEIIVADDGPGISQEEGPHIFERFYRGEKGKHGIGLSIVQSVVALHGGEVRAQCDGETLFIMTFPKPSNLGRVL